MIICNECGLQNDDSDAFCGNCGAFLEWEGQAVEPDPEPQPVVEPVQEEPDRPGLIERVVDRFQSDDDEDAAAGPPPEAGTSQATGSTEPTPPAPERPVTSGQHQPAPPRTQPPPPGQQPAPPRAEPSPGPPPPVERQPAPPSADAPPGDGPPTDAPPTDGPRTDPPPTGAEQAPPSDPGDPAVVAAQRAGREAEEAEAAQRAAEQRVREHAEVAETAHRKVTEAEAEQQRLERLAQEEGATEDPERSEGERVAAEARAEAEAEAARRAAEEAAEAERAREQAEAEARKEAEAAERARRAASLVARPKPPPQTPTGPGPAPPSKPPRKRRAAPATPSAPSDTAGEGTDPPGAVAPQARHPGRAQPRPTPKQRTEQKRRLRPGDLVCGQCGEGNAPERRFCRRCGASTVDAAPAEKPPWWRRLRRQPKTYEAGERPQRSTGSAKDKARGGAQKARSAKRTALKVMRIVALLAVVIGALAVTVGPWREPVVDWGMDRYDSVRQMVAPRFESLTALSAEASSELDGHPAGHAVDLANNTWWAAGASEDSGVGERLFIDFEPAADIGAIGVIPGAADTEEYVAQPRPRRLHLVFDTGETRTLEIEDDHDFQSFRIDPVEGASRVEVQVDAVWLGQDGSSVSITEIEFQTRN